MAIQQLRTERLSGNSRQISYLITGEASAADAYALLLTTAPSSSGGLPRRTLEASVEEQESEDGAGNIDYVGTVPYGKGGGSTTSDLEVGDTRILMSTIGGSVHITQSLETTHSFGDAEDHEEAIGVDGEGNVTGTDIATGGLDITIIKIVASTALTTSYVSNILSLSTPNPHTNDATFSHTDSDGRAISLSAGEMLFLGFTNTPRGNGEDELRFNFKGSANLADALPQTAWTVPKDGWEHLWIRYKQDVDGAANKLVAVPASAYVEKVYESGNYGLLSL